VRYTEDRVPRLHPAFDNAPEVAAAEVARLLSPFDASDLGEDDAVEAFVTFLIDVGCGDAAARFVLYASGLAAGFMRRPVPRTATEQWRIGHGHGLVSRAIHAEWRHG
jgi:hypothetical protein